MRRTFACVLAVALALGAAGEAVANTWNVSCNGATTLALNGGTAVAFGSDPGGMTGSGSGAGAPDALGALIGTPLQRTEDLTVTFGFGTTLSPGDVIEITGTCQQDITIRTPGLRLTNHNDTNATGTDGNQGQIEVAGARRTVINGLLLGSDQNAFSFASASDQALIFAHDGAAVLVEYSSLSNSPLLGILAQNSAQVAVRNTLVAGSGAAAPDLAHGVGIRAILGSAIEVSSPDNGAQSSDIAFNEGGGVALFSGSSLIVSAPASAAVIEGNGGAQLRLERASSAHVSGGIVDGSTCLANCSNAIEAVGSSNVAVDGGVIVLGITSKNAVSLIGGSVLLASSATIKAPASNTIPTIDAAENSVIALAGGNIVCSNLSTCDSSITGLAIVADHVSTLIQVPPQQFGYASAQDRLFGGGSVQLQSTVDLGVGLITASPSLTWTAGPSTVRVTQNSSFRLQGGVAITGVVSLAQGSNGFFNVSNGGTNTVSGGVTCLAVTIPAAHVAAPNAASLTPTPSLATTAFPTGPNQCLPF
jgi:hypothetical protein